MPSINGLMEQVREEFGIEDDEENSTLPLRIKTSYRNPGVDIHQPRMLIPRPDTPPSSLDFDEELSSPTDELPSLPAIRPRVASMIPDEEVDPSDASETASELERPQKSLSKREHALHELLSSERAYASDLALIREVHIPLALGEFLLDSSLDKFFVFSLTQLVMASIEATLSLSKSPFVFYGQRGNLRASLAMLLRHDSTRRKERTISLSSLARVHARV